MLQVSLIYDRLQNEAHLVLGHVRCEDTDHVVMLFQGRKVVVSFRKMGVVSSLLFYYRPIQSFLRANTLPV